MKTLKDHRFLTSVCIWIIVIIAIINRCFLFEKDDCECCAFFAFIAMINKTSRKTTIGKANIKLGLVIFADSMIDMLTVIEPELSDR